MSAKPISTRRRIGRALERPLNGTEQGSGIFVSGSDAPLGSKAITSVALLLHELATNAAKYGALSTIDGRLTITMSVADDTLRISWDEKVPGALPMQEAREGFGTALEKAVLSRLSGTIARNWTSSPKCSRRIRG